MFKKILCALLAALAVTAFASCGKKNENKSSNNATDSSVTTSVEDTADSADDTNSSAVDTDSNQTENIDPAATPKGFEEVEVQNEIVSDQLRFKNASVAKIGKNYVINVVYATVQTGRYYARTVNDPFIFDTTGVVTTSATGTSCQIDIPEEKIKDAKGETLEIGFLLDKQTNLDDYIIKLDLDKALAEAKEQKIDSLNLPFDIAYNNTDNKISSVTAEKNGDKIHFEIKYSFTGERKFNISYPVDENSITVTNDPTGLETSESTQTDKVGQNDPVLSNMGTYEFDYEASKLTNETNLIIRFYNPNDLFDADTLVINVSQLGRLG